MANTYSQIYIQVVFSVKGRQNLILSNWKDELHKYICGIVSGTKQKVLAIGGVADHIHILISVNPSVSISDLVKDIKANSSRWINERSFIKGKFQWQEGFGAFSYSYKEIDRVVKYINNQEKHHQKKTFKDEYLEFLDNFKVEFDEKYVFDWIE